MEQKITITLTKKEHEHLKALVLKGISLETLLSAKLENSPLAKFLEKIKVC